MRAQIYRKNENNSFEATKKLQIGGKNIAFFIAPIFEEASFLSSDDDKKWLLRFFINSPFEQELVVCIDDVERGYIDSRVGKACWINNSGRSEDDISYQEEASRFLRDSNTLNIDRSKELTINRTLIVDRDGMAYLSSDPEQFKRIVLCQSLAIAYRQVLSDCMYQMTRYVKSNLAEDALNLYENILRFNAAYYFSFPVLQNRHEISPAWLILYKHYELNALNQELVQQLSDVAALLREKREQARAEQERKHEQDRKKREQERAEQEKKYEKAQQQIRDVDAEKARVQKAKEDKKDKRRTLWLSLIGILLTSTSLLSLAQLTPKQLSESRNAWKTWWYKLYANDAIDDSKSFPAAENASPKVVKTKNK